MKRKLLYAGVFVLLACSFNSCSKTCKVCSQNTYNATSGALITAGSESEYCDTDLIKVQATPPVTILGVTTKWVCK